MRIIDLSQDIYEGMQVYPGHLKTVQFVHATHEETAPRFDSGFSFQTTGFMLNDNGPTHVDSFSHLDPDPAAETIEAMPLELFYGTAVCLDVTGVRRAPTSRPRTWTGPRPPRRCAWSPVTSCCSTPAPGTGSPGTGGISPSSPAWASRPANGSSAAG